MKGQGWRWLLHIGDLVKAQRLNGQTAQYYATRRYQQAIPLAQRALAIYEKALGSEHRYTLM